MSVPIEVAAPVAAEALRRLMPYAARGEVAGSIRRRKPMVKDVEIVVAPPMVSRGFFGEMRLGLEEVQEAAALLGQHGAEKCGPKYVQIKDVLGSGLNLDLFIVHGFTCLCQDCCSKDGGNEWGPIFTIRTGPADYSEWLVTKIKGRLWRCSGGHVTDDRGRYVPCPDEQSFFAAAQVPYVAPEERRT